MIHLDLSEIKSQQKIEMFGRILSQLVSQAGIYNKRGNIGEEPGCETLIGESMNLYVDYANTQLWVLPKPRIDG